VADDVSAWRTATGCPAFDVAMPAMALCLDGSGAREEKMAGRAETGLDPLNPPFFVLFAIVRSDVARESV
jgi:hypothetical protein